MHLKNDSWTSYVGNQELKRAVNKPIYQEISSKKHQPPKGKTPKETQLRRPRNRDPLMLAVRRRGAEKISKTHDCLRASGLDTFSMSGHIPTSVTVDWNRMPGRTHQDTSLVVPADGG